MTRKDFNLHSALGSKIKTTLEKKMFKKSILMAALLLVGQLSFAANVVVFDHEQALLETQVAKKKIEALKAKPQYAQMTTQLESLRTDLEAMAKDANSKGMTWSAEEKADHRKKMEYIQADMKLAAQKIQAENSAVINAILEEMQPKLEKALKNYVDSKEADIILRKQAAYVAKPSHDITGKITKALDEMK